MYYFRRMRFPRGRKKALTFSYDDDVVFNERLMEIFDRNGLKGTFNLNFGLFASPEAKSTRRMTAEQAKLAFSGRNHEVAAHGYTHMPLGQVPKNVATQDVLLDLLAGESLFGRIIRGMAYADGSFNEESGEVLAQCGIDYCRTVRATGDFRLPKDWRYLDPTCHHDDERLFELADRFLEKDPSGDGWMFYVWGHAYEFEDKNNWERIESFCEKMGNRPEIWYATNIEIHDYVRDYRRLIFSADGTKAYNPTATTLYFAVGERKDPLEYEIKPGEQIEIVR